MNQEQVTAHVFRYRKGLQALIFAIVRDHHLTEDVLQEVSIALLAAHDRITGERALRAFARETARRQALAAARRRQRHPVLLGEEALERLDQAMADIDPDTIERRRDHLLACIAALPAVWQRIVHLRYWSGHSVKDIARHLERSVNGLSVVLHRIRARLADCVEHRLGEDAAL